jgi:hypothetical protein
VTFVDPRGLRPTVPVVPAGIVQVSTTSTAYVPPVPVTEPADEFVTVPVGIGCAPESVLGGPLGENGVLVPLTQAWSSRVEPGADPLVKVPLSVLSMLRTAGTAGALTLMALRSTFRT